MQAAIAVETYETPAPTLYDRLGGERGITLLVDEIVKLHLENPVVKARYLPVAADPARLAVIKQHTVQFISAGTGGPSAYAGKSMPDAHRGMNVSDAEYLAVVDDIIKALERRGASQAVQNEMLAIAYALRPQIVRL